jgi:predicted TIM-barrel fold metal-dependent hydrolase
MVDVHSHVYPATYRDAISSLGVPVPVSEESADLAAKLRFMDERRIDRAIVSLGNPWLAPFGADSGVLADTLNAELAELPARSDGRLFALGVLPDGPIEAVTATAAAVAAEPGLYGLISGTRICGLRLDDARLDALWDELADSGLPLFVHPHWGLGAEADAEPGSLALLGLGFPLETTLALGKLLLAGVLDRFPGLRVVAAHCGGALPVLAGRLEAYWQTGWVDGEPLSRSPRSALAQLAFDALGYSPSALRAVIEVAGAERLFFGTDHPFPVSATDSSSAALETVLAGEQLDAVYGTAAEAYFALPAR